MFPTSLQHPYAPRGRRRGRNDPNSRDYICPCGKSYLSYPALFTHIKIKHNGRAPGQIIKPKTQNPSKRGRPRQKQVYDSDSDTNDIAANCIDRLCDFVTEFQKPQQSLCSRLKDLYLKDAFYRVYVNYNPQQQQPRYNERQDLYEQYSDNVFCQLIAEVNKRLNEPYHIDSVIVILMLLGHFVNENTVVGENEVEKRRDQDQEYEDEGYAENQDQYENQIENNQEIIQQQQYHSSSQEQHQNLNKNTNNQHQKQQKLPQSDNLIQQKEKQQQNINQNNHKNVQNQQQINQQQDEQQDLQQIEANNQESLMKLKHQPIRNIVNYVNDFIINYQSKYFNIYHFQNYPFFLQNNVKIFLQLFFNWLTMKKYVGYKVKINQHYQ